VKDCSKRGGNINLGGVIYHECCHENKEMFIFCENAIKARACPEEK
jgi:hypothetical protein